MKQKLRLGVLISSLTIGGAEQLLLELLRAMDRKKFDVELFFLRETGRLGIELEALGFPTQTRIIASKFDPIGLLKLSGLFKRRKVEALLLINHRNSLFYGVLAGRLAGIRCIVNWENETYLRYSFHTITMIGRRILHLGIDRVVAAAQGHKEYIHRVEGVPLKKITTIYNGVDPEKFGSPLLETEAKKRLHIPAGSPVVSIIAVLRPDKNHEVFLKAARNVLNVVPSAHFLVIGDGPRRMALTLLSNQLGIEGQVHFLGFQRRLADILAAVDINTLSSKPQQETLSVAVIEAMSAGIPNVCPDVGFMREIVIPGKTGYLVGVDDPRALAEKLVHLIGNPHLRKEMGKNAIRLVREKLSTHKMARAFENLFYDVYCRKSIKR